MENFEQIISNLKTDQNFSGDIKLNEPLAPKTTFKVGGNAKVYIAPDNTNSFATALKLIKESHLNYFILGGGSNIVFPDEIYNGIILSTEKLHEISIVPNNQTEPLSERAEVLVRCESGTSIAAFVNFCTKNNLSGAEKFAGLPGKIGGAVFMNARCFEKSISDILFSTEHLDYSNPDNIQLLENQFDQSQWDYKVSPFQQGNKIITAATFKLEQKSSEFHSEIENECKKYITERTSKGHFNFPSAGSVFKNNHEFGKPSGKIIDEAGLKGYQIGGAQIASFHGNFIINVNQAKASQIKELVQYTQQIVQEKFGFKLETEIIFVDNQL